jgi:alkylhydroperoxidase family enzyme
VGSHARNLQLQGASQDVVDSVAEGKIDPTKLDEKDRALLTYVELLTLHPSQVRDPDVEKLRKAGWNDDEIFEATFDTALFAFFNRMADAYGLDYPSGGWLPESMRKPAGE